MKMEIKINSQFLTASIFWLILAGCTEIKSVQRTPEPKGTRGLELTATDGTFVVKASWLTRVQELEYESVFLTFHDPESLEPLAMEPQLFFDPQMPSMGHGTATEEQTFSFGKDSTSVLIENVFFIMGGDWTVTIGAKPLGGDEDTVFLDLYVHPLPEEDSSQPSSTENQL